MKNIWMKFWPFIVTLVGWALVALVFLGCRRCNSERQLKKENEELREELLRLQEWAPLEVERFRDSLTAVAMSVRPVEDVKAVLSQEDRQLLKELRQKVKAIESYQKIGLRTKAGVSLTPALSQGEGFCDTIATYGTDTAKNERLPPEDSVLTYKDRWLDLRYNTGNRFLVIELQDSLAISVTREYKRKFLWWRWGVKGYEVKAVSFNPYTTIRYNSFVKKKD